MTFHRQGYCSSGLSADFTGTHPEIEFIKDRAKKRQDAGEKPRIVGFVTRPAKQKNEISKPIFSFVQDVWKGHVIALQHWALRLDGRYLDLHRIPGTTDAEFVKRDRDPSREASITSVRDKIGLTYMTDNEILAVGNHLIRCWRREYATVTNNCQILLLEVCRACLVDFDRTLEREWLGSKLFDGVTRVIYPSVETVLKMLGCPEEDYEDWTVAFRNWCVGALAAPLSDRYGGKEDLKDALLTSSDPIVTFEEQYIRRVIMGVQRTAAVFSHLPGIKRSNERSGKFEVTNLQSKGQKWTNRLAMVVGPVQAVMTASGLVRDTMIIALTDDEVIRDAFTRRKELFGEFSPLKAVVKYARGLVTKDPDEMSRSFKLFLLKLRGIMDLLNRCWSGDASLPEIAIKFEDLMQSQKVSWKNCSGSLLYITDGPRRSRPPITQEERDARRTAMVIMLILKYILTEMAWAVTLTHHPIATINHHPPLHAIL